MSRQNVELMGRGIAAWNSGDLERYLQAIEETVHPELEWHAVIAELVEGRAAVYRGHEGMRQFWHDWHDVWDFHFDDLDFRDLGETLVVLAQISATGRASGAQLKTPLAMVATFSDGLLIRLESYLDHEEALAAVGLRD
jgi:ketosteroid isomerase-like protein